MIVTNCHLAYEKHKIISQVINNLKYQTTSSSNLQCNKAKFIIRFSINLCALFDSVGLVRGQLRVSGRGNGLTAVNGLSGVTATDNDVDISLLRLIRGHQASTHVHGHLNAGTADLDLILTDVSVPETSALAQNISAFLVKY